MLTVSSTARTSGYLRDKTLAQWMALNRLSEVRLNCDQIRPKHRYRGDLFRQPNLALRYPLLRHQHRDDEARGGARLCRGRQDQGQSSRRIHRVLGDLRWRRPAGPTSRTGPSATAHPRAAWYNPRDTRRHPAGRYAARDGFPEPAGRPRLDAHAATDPDARPPRATEPPTRKSSRGCGAGFTLIEILVALLILGIMAALGYGTYRAARISAERTEESLKRSREIEFGMRIMVQDFAETVPRPVRDIMGQTSRGRDAGHGRVRHAHPDTELGRRHRLEFRFDFQRARAFKPELQQSRASTPARAGRQQSNSSAAPDPRFDAHRLVEHGRPAAQHLAARVLWPGR